MSGHETSSASNGVDDLQKLFTNAARGQNAQSRETGYESGNKHEGKVGRRVKMGIAAVAGLALATTITGGVYVWKAAAANGIGDHASGSAAALGKAEIISVDMDIQPITLSTAKTHLEAKAAINHEFKIFGIGINTGEDSVTGAADVTTEITVDPNEVTFTYDPKEEALTMKMGNTALATNVDILTGDWKQTAESGSLNTALSRDTDNLLSTIDGTVGKWFDSNLSKNSSTITLQNLLTEYDQLYMVTQVDAQCTPLIPTAVSDFDKQLKDNIRTAAQGELLDADNDVSSALNKLPLEKVKKIVAASTVELPDNYMSSIVPDQEKIDALKKLKYKNSEIFQSSMSEPKVSCGVSTDAKLTSSTGDSNG